MPNLRRIRSSSPRPGCEPPSPAFDSSIILPAFNFDDFESRGTLDLLTYVQLRSHTEVLNNSRLSYSMQISPNLHS